MHFNIISRWLIKFLEVQLLLSLVALPFLVSWGLPISVCAPLGNLISIPFVCVFLFISSLIFFLLLLNISCDFLFTCLEYCTFFWEAFLQCGVKSSLISCASPSYAWCIGLEFITIATLFCVASSKIRVLIFGILYCASIVYLHKYVPARHALEHISCNTQEVILYRSQGNTFLIDDGALGRSPSYDSWIQFTLLPHLRKKYATTTVDYLLLLKPSTRIFDAVKALCNTTIVHTIYLVYWQGDTPRNMARAYMQMKNILQEQNVVLIRFGNDGVRIHYAANHYVTIRVQGKRNRHAALTYPHCIPQFSAITI